MSDADLVRETLGGRIDAYAELVRRWSSRVLAVCHARIGRADAAEDMAQETFLRGLKSLASLSDPAKVGAWLGGIAQRVCLDWLKSKQQSSVPLSTLGSNGSWESRIRPLRDRPNEEREAECQQLMAEVEALPEPFREAVLLYYYEDVTYQELAEWLGVSPATVNARLTRARAMLRERLSEPVEP